MAAFRRMLQVGVKTENCLMRYHAFKAHSTSHSSSSKMAFGKKAVSHLKPEAADFGDDWERERDEYRKQRDAESVARVEKMKKEARDFYKSQCEAIDKEIQKIQIGTIVSAFVLCVAATVPKFFKEVHGPSP